MEEGEEFRILRPREVLEETGAAASIIKYIGKSQYTFTVPEDTVEGSTLVSDDGRQLLQQTTA